MIQISPTSKPFIDRELKQFVTRLADEGIFEKQLDAWAYAAAYAMKHQLEPKAKILQAEMPQLQHLDSEMLYCLMVALAALKPELETEEQAVTELSRLASAGATAIHEQIARSGRHDAYEFLLKQI